MKNRAFLGVYTAIFIAKKRYIARNILHKGNRHFIILPINRHEILQNGKMGAQAVS
jgi:hypothetical protein